MPGGIFLLYGSKSSLPSGQRTHTPSPRGRTISCGEHRGVRSCAGPGPVTGGDRGRTGPSPCNQEHRDMIPTTGDVTDITAPSAASGAGTPAPRPQRRSRGPSASAAVVAVAARRGGSTARRQELRTLAEAVEHVVERPMPSHRRSPASAAGCQAAAGGPRSGPPGTAGARRPSSPGASRPSSWARARCSASAHPPGTTSGRSRPPGPSSLRSLRHRPSRDGDAPTAPPARRAARTASAKKACTSPPAADVPRGRIGRPRPAQREQGVLDGEVSGRPGPRWPPGPRAHGIRPRRRPRPESRHRPDIFPDAVESTGAPHSVLHCDHNGPRGAR